MLRKLSEALDKRHERKSLQRLTTHFAQTMLTVACAEDCAYQSRVAMSARETYHAFIARYPEVADFTNASRSERLAYLDGLSKDILNLEGKERIQKLDKGVTAGVILIHCWIAALAWHAFQIADAMAEQIERDMQHPMERSFHIE